MATQRFYDGQPGPDIRRELNNFEAKVDGTVAAAQDASTGAISASVKAQQWADAAPGVEVETGKYSAKHWADRAQTTVTGGLIYRGSHSAASGAYPATPSLGDYYKISIAGTLGGVAYSVGDSIIYNGTDWDKIDSTDAVTSVAGQVGAVVLTKDDVQLSNVDNTSDANKPISTATQTALDGKADTSHSHAVTDVGLGNVDNTSDANKPISTATQTALDGKANTSHSHAIAEVTDLQSALDGKESTIAAGTETQYWRGDKTWRDFFTDVRAATLTGLSTATNAVIEATDTVLGALEKLQAQISSKVSKSGDTMTGNLMVEGVGHADVAVRSYGYGGDGATMHGYQSRGTKALPTAPTAGDPIFGIGARPYTGAGWAEHSVGAVHIFARQNITTTQQGTSFRIATTPLGGTWNDRIHAVAFECDGVGQGSRWRAKFSGATQAERTFVQDASGASTAFGVLSGGASGSSAAVNCFSRNDPDNSPYVQLAANEAIGVSRVYSGALGTASALPLVLSAGTSPGLTIETSGNVLVTGGALGYGVGAGGAVVQATSKSTAVTLNKPCGQIKMHAENMNANGSVTFALNSTAIGGGYNDVVVVTPVANASYEARSVSVEPGLAYIRVTNISGSSRAEALSLNFAVIKTST